MTSTDDIGRHWTTQLATLYRQSPKLPVLQTPALDGSKVLPFDRLNAELFYPTRNENIDTNEIVKVVACEVAECLLEELSDPKMQLLIISQSLVANSVGEKQLKKNTMLALGS